MRRLVRGILVGGIALMLACAGLIALHREELQYVVEHAIEIDAPADRVWAILADTAAYPQWNPYLLRIEGEMAPGRTIAVTLAQRTFREPLTVRPTLVHVSAPELRWQGRVGVPGLLDTDHSFVVETISPSRSRLVQREEFRGLLARFFRTRKPDMQAATHESFVKMNRALAARAEAGAP